MFNLRFSNVCHITVLIKGIVYITRLKYDFWGSMDRQNPFNNPAEGFQFRLSTFSCLILKLKVSQRFFIWPVLCIWAEPFRWLKQSSGTEFHSSGKYWQNEDRKLNDPAARNISLAASTEIISGILWIEYGKKPKGVGSKVKPTFKLFCRFCEHIFVRLKEISQLYIKAIRPLYPCTKKL